MISGEEKRHSNRQEKDQKNVIIKVIKKRVSEDQQEITEGPELPKKDQKKGEKKRYQ